MPGTRPIVMISIPKIRLLPTASILALAIGAPAFAADSSASSESAPAPASGKKEIVVVAERLRDQVDAPEPPIIVLDEEDIDSYGAASIEELLDDLAPEVSSGRGRGSGQPVILVNGMRISSFREIRSYPPEAIRRVEVLPEDVALKFGFSADQRVINFILKDGFNSREAELHYGQPADGGYSKEEAEGTYLKIAGPSRLNLHVDWNTTSLLTEGQRGVIQSPSSLSQVASDPNPADYRSLVPESTNLELTGNWTTKLANNGSSLSLNGTVQRADTNSLSGLNTVLLTDPSGDSLRRTYGELDPLATNSTTTTYSLGSTLNAPLGGWQMTATVDASRAETNTLIDRNADNSALIAAAAAGQLALNCTLPNSVKGPVDQANTVSYSATSLLTVMGSPLTLPAGAVSMTLSTGFAWSRSDNNDTRNPGVETSLARGDLSAGIHVGIPIASRRENAWSWLGDFNLNFSAGIDRLSDFGYLGNWTAGAVWGVTPKLNLQATFIARDTAPSLSQLSSPEVVTLNVPVYDFSRGETVLVTTIGGGNPDLAKQRQRDIRLAAQWTLPFFSRSNLMVEYFRNHSSNVAISFPVLTPAIEAAFPGNVVRDSSGRLISIDQRPITVAEEHSSSLKFSLNLGGPFGKAMPVAHSRRFGEGGFPPPDGPPPGGPDEDHGGRGDRASGGPSGDAGHSGGGPGGGPGGPGGFGPGGGGPGGGGFHGGGARGGGRGNDGRGRWSLSFSYTANLANTALIAPGLPVLDLLNGDALSGGGVARYTAQMEGGVFYRNLGLRFTGNYSGSTHVDGTGLPGSSSLYFGSLATLNLRAFADLGKMPSLTRNVPFLKGTRVSLMVNNVFDTRQKVTDASGAVPLSYQPFMLDPTGRYIGIQFRKLF